TGGRPAPTKWTRPVQSPPRSHSIRWTEHTIDLHLAIVDRVHQTDQQLTTKIVVELTDLGPECHDVFACPNAPRHASFDELVAGIVRFHCLVAGRFTFVLSQLSDLVI